VKTYTSNFSSIKPKTTTIVKPITRESRGKGFPQVYSVKNDNDDSVVDSLEGIYDPDSHNESISEKSNPKSDQNKILKNNGEKKCNTKIKFDGQDGVSNNEEMTDDDLRRLSFVHTPLSSSIPSSSTSTSTSSKEHSFPKESSPPSPSVKNSHIENDEKMSGKIKSISKGVVNGKRKGISSGVVNALCTTQLPATIQPLSTHKRTTRFSINNDKNVLESDIKKDLKLEISKGVNFKDFSQEEKDWNVVKNAVINHDAQGQDIQTGI
jgi:hypothetical protein